MNDQGLLIFVRLYLLRGPAFQDRAMALEPAVEDTQVAVAALQVPT